MSENIDMATLKKQFEKMVDFAQSTDSGIDMNNEQKLKLYALYKQATEGDVTGKKPGRMNVVGRTKHTAREAYVGMSANDAMQAYIDFVNEFK